MPLHWRGVDPLRLDKVFLTDILALFEPCPFHFTVTYGLRTREEQRRLYEAHLAYLAYIRGTGPKAPFAGKAAPPGMSAHEFGMAIDVALDGDPAKPGLQPTWNVKMAGWVWLAAKCFPHPRLKHGSRFSSQDWPHVERYKWFNHKPK